MPVPVCVSDGDCEKGYVTNRPPSDLPYRERSIAIIINLEDHRYVHANVTGHAIKVEERPLRWQSIAFNELDLSPPPPSTAGWRGRHQFLSCCCCPRRNINIYAALKRTWTFSETKCRHAVKQIGPRIWLHIKASLASQSSFFLGRIKVRIICGRPLSSVADVVIFIGRSVEFIALARVTVLASINRDQ